MNLRDLGVHRVVAPTGALPQAAERLDPSLPIGENEVLIDVETLNIDSASFHQILGEVGRDEDAVARRIQQIVAERGKMQNPVTGSGGMLLGRVAEVGSAWSGTLRPGDRVATLVSLTLTPLAIRRVVRVRLDADQVDIEGHAVLWPSAPMVRMPDDLDERLALAVLDVCGAPAQVARLVRPGAKVVVLGTGKSGLLCLAEARRQLGSTGRLVALDRSEAPLRALADAGLCDAWAVVDATNPTATAQTVNELLGGLADVVINTVNVERSEMSAILGCRDGGTVYFFNMATSFARAALGAEGVGRDATLIIGNGYAPGHAELALDLVRTVPFVRDAFGRAAGAA